MCENPIKHPQLTLQVPDLGCRLIPKQLSPSHLWPEHQHIGSILGPLARFQVASSNLIIIFIFSTAIYFGLFYLLLLHFSARDEDVVV